MKWNEIGVSWQLRAGFQAIRIFVVRKLFEQEPKSTPNISSFYYTMKLLFTVCQNYRTTETAKTSVWLKVDFILVCRFEEDICS